MCLVNEFEKHRKDLLKALDDTYVLVGIRSDNIEAMINQFIRGHRLFYMMKSCLLKGGRITRHCISLSYVVKGS